jgi:hypothetical protein
MLFGLIIKQKTKLTFNDNRITTFYGYNIKVVTSSGSE